MASSYYRELNDLRRAAQREYADHLGPLIASGIAAGRKAWGKTPMAPKKSGLGGYIAAGFGVALIAGAAYLAWQVLRTDDEAWIDDDFDVD